MRHKLRQWHILYTHVWWNKLRRRYDAAYILLNNNGEWHHSSFPHPLVVLDHDENGNLIGVEIIGRNLKAELS